MNVFFDLDGTLIDSRPRLYYLFQYLVQNSTLSFDEYWDFKRNKINHYELLTTHFNHSEEQFKAFETIWMAEIELEKWLDMDTPFEGVEELLKDLSKKYTLHIVTARQNVNRTKEQLQKFSWHALIQNTLITEQSKTKIELIRNAVTVSPDDWFVGDTGKDIETGKQLGIKTAAVHNGFLSKESLLPYKPDYMLNKVTDLYKILLYDLS